MTFETSLELLKFHNVVYTIYALLIISIIAWFGYNLTRTEKVKSIVRIPFYGYIAFLVAGGVGHHIFTYNTIPWVSQDITRHDITPDRTYNVEVADHKFKLPAEKMVAKKGEKVYFNVTSKDVIYGFGLFRKDGTMVMQMQVNPGSENDILWTFNECGVFDLRSTEYSGPEGNSMFVKDAVEITGCNNKGVAS
jgi:cytochrome c oxidase subunit 2